MKPPIFTRITPDLTKIALSLIKVPDFIGPLKVTPVHSTRLVWPERFAGHGASIVWSKYVKTAAQKMDFAKAAAPQKAGGKGLLTNAAHLRWMMDASLGMPVSPFRVWRRYGTDAEGRALDPLKSATKVGDVVNIEFSRRLAKLIMFVRAGPQGAIFSALRGTPVFEGAEYPVFVPANAETIVTLSSPAMAGVSLAGVAEVFGATGITIEDYANADGWQLMETVGLPGKAGPHPALSQWHGKQGVGATPGLSPYDAALDRLARGGPPIGWRDRMDPATAAPVWTAPAFGKLVDSLLREYGLVESLFDAMTLPGPQQRDHRVPVDIDAVVAGPVTLPPGSGGLPTLGVTQLAASTDPFLALALGFGTAVPPPTGDDVIRLKAMSQSFGRFRVTPSVDYLVTADFQLGSKVFEFAAPIPQPPPGLVPFAPTTLTALPKAADRPKETDGPWRVEVPLEWDRVPRNSLYTVASVAGARVGETGCCPILERRAGGDWQAIAATAGTDADGNPLPRVGVRDPGVELMTATSSQRWGVTQQTVFGLWSPWTTKAATVSAPDAQIPVIASVRLDAVAGAKFTDPCTASAEIELIYDWSVRSPASFTLRGRMYQATTRSAPLPDVSLPAGFARGTAVGGAEIAVSFSGDTASIGGVPGATITPVDPDSGEALGNTPGSGPVRRYRIHIPNLSVDFALGHAGIGVWVAGTERVEPKRTSKWTEKPRSAGVSDPRPPEPAVDPVPRIGSLPDAQGRSHVGLTWKANSPGARYEVYECDEMTLLAKAGKPEPAIEATLVQRLKTLNDLDFVALRDGFARRDGPPITGNSVDVAMPRGSTVYHAFIVIGTSVGGVDSAWPKSVGVQIVFPARAIAPSPPWLEVRIRDGQVEAVVTPQPGVPPKDVELFRTRLHEAATHVSLMGPPVALKAVQGPPPVIIPDAPEPSWRPYWYRAVCRSADDFDKGRFGARGEASSAFKLFVPPSAPPAIADAVVVKAGAGQLSLFFSCALPKGTTPAGAHNIAIEYSVPGGMHFAIDALPAGVSRRGADWRIDFARPVAQAFDLVVRVTDPLGRASEETLTVPASLTPQPVLFGVQATANATRTLVTFLTIPDAFSTAAGQSMIIEAPGLGLIVPPVLLKSLTTTAKTIGAGVKASKAGAVAGLTGVSIVLPSTTGTVRVTVTGGGETMMREVPARW